jgi:hypothetical protein
MGWPKQEKENNKRKGSCVQKFWFFMMAYKDSPMYEFLRIRVASTGNRLK